MGIGDTALVNRWIGGDSVEWLLHVPLTDGIARDSFSFRHKAGSAALAWPVGADGRLLMARAMPGLVEYTTVERDGRAVDSVTLDLPRVDWRTSETVRGGRDILVIQRRAEGLGDYDILRFRIGADGGFSSHADTVLAGLNGWFSSEPNGMLATATGTPVYEVWSMTRTGGTGMKFDQRRLASGTAPLGGTMDPAGGRVALWRRAVVGGKALLQISVTSADSGGETLVGPPRDIADYEWTKDGRALVVAVNEGDTTVISEQEIETGRLRPLTKLPKREFEAISTIPGGGVAIRTQDSHRIYLRAIPGRPDTLYDLPESEGSIFNFDAAPDGSALVAVGWDRNYDSLVVRRIELPSLRATKLWTVYGDGAQIPTWLRDGTIIIQIKENASTLVWYRIPAAGGRAVRLGTPPRAADATFRLSPDGRRVIARVNTIGRDVYLIRNFRQLLGE